MNKSNKPESEMMGAHYDPHLSEGSAKVPIFTGHKYTLGETL